MAILTVVILMVASVTTIQSWSLDLGELKVRGEMAEETNGPGVVVVDKSGAMEVLQVGEALWGPGTEVIKWRKRTRQRQLQVMM